MAGRFRRSVVMALVVAMCFTQNPGIIRAAEAPEKMEAEATVSGETSVVDAPGSDIGSEIISEKKVENNSNEDITENKVGIDSNEDTAENSAEGVTAEEEPAGGSPADRVTFDSINLTPFNYYANLRADYTFEEPVEDYERLVILYTEGDKEVSNNKGVVSRNSLDNDGVNTGWRRLGCGNYNQKKKGTGNGRLTKTIAGGVIENEDQTGAIYTGLKPNTTYSYYITLEKTNVTGDIYILTEKNTFTTTTSTIDQTKVTGKSVTRTVFGSRVEVNNPDNEYIGGFYFDVAGKTSITDEELGQEENDDYITGYEKSDDGDYYIVYYPKNISFETRNHLYAVVYTGPEKEDPSLNLVDMGEVDTKEVINKDNFHVTYEPGITSIKATVSFDCGEAVPEDLNDLYLRVFVSGGYDEDMSISIKCSDVIWEKTEKGICTEMNVIDRCDPDDEDYDNYFIIPDKEFSVNTAIGTENILDDLSTSIYETGSETVKTLPDKQINKSEFDEVFLGLLDINGLKIPEGETVSQSNLDRITEIATWTTIPKLTSIKGIKYVRNLRYVEINDNLLEDISEIVNCRNLEHMEFMSNSIKTLPDLRDLKKLRELHLDWNYIPDDEIAASKLPSSLVYFTDKEYPETLDGIATTIREFQHKKSNFISETVYVDSVSGNYPFKMIVSDHKLASLLIEKYAQEKKKASFYIFKAASGDAQADETATTKVGIINNSKTAVSDEIVDEFREEYGLDEIYYSADKQIAYTFNVASVAGISSSGTHPVTWQLYKRNIWLDTKTGKTVSADSLIWEDTVTAVYGSGIVASVSVSPKTLDLSVGGSSKLTATVTTVPATMDKSVTWTTGDPKVATVDAQGNVTAVGKGATTITAASKIDGTKKDTCSVTVKDAAPVEPVVPTGLLITTTEGKDTTFVGSKLTLKAEFIPTGATADVSKVKYETKDMSIVSLSGADLTGLAEGTAVINGSYTVSEGSVLTSQLTVKVRRSGEEKKTFYKVDFLSGNTLIYTESVLEGQPATEPAVKPEQPDHMFIGWGINDSAFDFTTPVYSNLTLTAIFRKNKVEVTDNSGSGMDAQPDTDLKKEGDKVTGDIYLVKGQTYTAENAGKDWTTDKSAVAKVAKGNGKITAAGEGDAKVSNSTHEFNVHVVEPAIVVSKVAGKASTVDPKKVSLLVGESAEYKIDKITKNTDKYPVTWYSSNTQVAAVTDGVVTAIAKGSANISAFVGGKEYKGKVTVTDTLKAPEMIATEAEININAMKAVQLKFSTFKPNGSTWEAAGDSKKLEVADSDKKGNPVLWRNDIIEITNKGKVTGIGEGSTKIKGTDTKGGTVTVTVNVKVINTKTAAFISKDKTATLKFPNVNNKKAEWLSSDPSKVSVDNDKNKGKIKGIAAGSSSVTCSVNNANGIVFETLVYCEEPQLKVDPAGKLKLDTKGKGLTGSINLDAGEVYRMEISGISGIPAFKSGNKSAVFVDENGLIYARQKGKRSNITAKINGKTLRIVVNVNK